LISRSLYRSAQVFALLLILIVQLGVHTPLYAQDPQFSQFYAAPLYLNPALTGINQMGRAGLNYRNQWPSIDASFETYSFYIDYFIESKHSGVGLIVNTDKEGRAGLKSTNVGLQYAYQARISYDWTFRAGTELSYYQRDINFAALTFGDMYDNNGLTGNPTQESFNTGQNARFFDMSFGGILFNGNAWLGSAMHHVLEPNQSLGGGESPLWKKFSIHGGYRIPFTAISPRAKRSTKGAERSMTPTINYKQQGSFRQLDMGIYFTLEPVLLGVWYRGLPVNGFEGDKFSESIVSMVGFNKRNLTIGYSFDFVVSDLSAASGGAHELSLTYRFSLDDPRKPSREVRELRCPVPYIF